MPASIDKTFAGRIPGDHTLISETVINRLEVLSLPAGRPRKASGASDSPGVAALVLAAGTSERFGGRKQLAHIADVSLLQLTLDAVRWSVVRTIVLVVGHHAAEVVGSIDASRVEVVHNPSYREGLSSSIRAGLAALQEEVSGVLMVLGDQPLVRSDTINRLMEAFRSTDCRAVVPSFGGRRGNPVLLDISLRPQMELLEGDVGCREILERLDDIQVVEVDDPGVLMDVDTLGDLDVVREMLHAGDVGG